MSYMLYNLIKNNINHKFKIKKNSHLDYRIFHYERKEMLKI